jgi:hypothetical protein
MKYNKSYSPIKIKEPARKFAGSFIKGIKLLVVAGTTIYTFENAAKSGMLQVIIGIFPITR